MRKEKTEQNIYREVTNLIVTKMSGMSYIWKRDYPCLWPVNWITKENYGGINYLFLTGDFTSSQETMDTRNYITCPYYATEAQIINSGGKVKEGAESRQIISSLSADDGSNGGEQLTYCELYNMINTEGVTDFNYSKWATMPEPKWPSDDEFMKGYKTILNIYEPDEDMMTHIRRIDKTWFDVDDFVNIVFMVLVHGTGRPDQLNRFEKPDFSLYGKPGDTEERLIGEIGTAMLCDYVGICSWVEEDAFGFLNIWKKVLAEDEQLIFRACAKAQEAVNYILGI